MTKIQVAEAGLVPRLETIDAVEEYLKLHPRELHARQLLAFARKTPLVRPSALDLLPRRISFQVHVIKDALLGEYVERNMDDLVVIQEAAEYLEELRGELLNEAASITGGYEDVARELVAEGRAILEKGKRRNTVLRGDETSVMHGMSGVFDLPEVLGEVLYRYLTKRETAAAAFVKRVFVRMTMFDDAQIDQRFLDVLKNDPATSLRLYAVLYRRLGVDVVLRRNQSFNGFSRRLMGSTKQRVMTLRPEAEAATSEMRALARFKQGVFVYLNAIPIGDVDAYKSAEATHVQIEILCKRYEGKVDVEVIRKILSLSQNLCEKLKAFHGYFERTFRLGMLERVRMQLGNLHNMGLDELESSSRRYTEQAEFVLYPCKCYLEFLKGFTSRDCSKNPRLAAEHMRSPLFFNIRVYTAGSLSSSGGKERWIGNIYCLDFTREHNTILIDRVQLSRGNSVFPISFFPNLAKALGDGVVRERGIRLLAPLEEISNFPGINQSYEKYAEGRRTAEFTNHQGFEYFECSSETRFVVINDLD
jgi:hypothetical protein